MSTLSPAAQAVYDAFWGAFDLEGSKDLSAALRAAVEQVLPVPPRGFNSGAVSRDRQRLRADLLAIATELENAS